MTDTDQVQLVLNRREAEALVGAALVALTVLEDHRLAGEFYSQKKDEARAFIAQMVTREALQAFDLITLVDDVAGPALLSTALAAATDSVRVTIGGIMKALEPESFSDLPAYHSPYR